MKVIFTTEFYPEVWDSLDEEGRNRWVDTVNDAISELVYVSDVQVDRKVGS